ncbi:addiction module protein [Gillisia sp. Q332]|uniref:addiction module protein n=1 Tax=Gillisia xinjiangensis TaxID=3384765 RepID=UPI00391D9891
MVTIEIKNRIRNYIEHADERMLKIINAIIETDVNELSESHKEVLDERLKDHQENLKEGKSWEEIQTALKKQYGL